MASGQIKNTFTSLGEVEASLLPSSLVLKLALTPHFLRYFVYSTLQHSVIYMGEYALHHVNSNEDLTQRVERIFEKDEVLQLPFGESISGVDSRYSLLPEDLLFMATSQHKMQKCKNQKLAIVYEASNDASEILQKVLPAAKITHLNSTFLNLLPSYLEEGKEKLFINLVQDYFDVVKFNAQNELLLMNRYWYVTDTDFVYYLLLCSEELGIDREKTELVLIGDIDRKSKVYEMCYKYYRNLSFIKKPDEIGFTKAFNDFPTHRHFNLYNLQA